MSVYGGARGDNLREWGLSISVFPRLQESALWARQSGTAACLRRGLTACPSRPPASGAPSSPVSQLLSAPDPLPSCAPRPPPRHPCRPASHLGAPGSPSAAIPELTAGSGGPRVLSVLDVDGTCKVTLGPLPAPQWPLGPETFKFRRIQPLRLHVSCWAAFCHALQGWPSSWALGWPP